MNNPNGKSLGTAALLGRFSLALCLDASEHLRHLDGRHTAERCHSVEQHNRAGIRNAKLGAPVVARAMAQSAMGQI